VNALERSIRAAFRKVDDVFESPSALGTDEDIAYWVNAKEIAHWDRDGSIGIRLTRKGISERRAELKSDERVDLRRSGSDWVRVLCTSRKDVPLVLELFEAAVQAHRAPPGQASKPPPTGAALERRRRFH
jgi:luciferase-like monooxygenase